jgi:hypothetical protein
LFAGVFLVLAFAFAFVDVDADDFPLRCFWGELDASLLSSLSWCREFAFFFRRFPRGVGGASGAVLSLSSELSSLVLCCRFRRWERRDSGGTALLGLEAFDVDMDFLGAIV